MAIFKKYVIFALLACQTMTLTNAAKAESSPVPVASGLPIFLQLSVQQQASLGLQVTTVQSMKDAQVLVSATVVVPPGKEFTVSAPYPGQVSRLLVGVGDTVKAARSLALFTSPMLGDARRLLLEASLDSKNATAAVQRDQALYDEGIIPAVRLQLSRSKQEVAQSLLRAREAELLATGMRFDANSGYATGTIQAPLSGTVSEAFVAVGQRVEAGALLFKLADTSQLQIDLQLSSDKASQMKVGDAVSIPSRSASAKITGVSRALDASQSARARALVIQRGSLQVGELVTVAVHTEAKPSLDKLKSHWLIPSRSVTQWSGKSWVFVANDKGFVAQEVNIISSTDDLSLVEATLSAGSKVAMTGVASLRAMMQKDN